MQSTTTKRAVVIAGCTNLGMNEEQPTQGGEFSCATKPAICIPPSVSACYRRSHRRRPSRDLPAESMCFDVEHVPVSGPLLRLLILIVVVWKQDGGWKLTSATWGGAIGELGADAAIRSS
jgi:hypothetical protein